MKKETLGRIVLIHGIKGDNPERSIGSLTPFLRRKGFSVTQPSYGTFSLFGIGLSGLMDKHIARSLANLVHPTDILIGHSNGGTLAYMISKIKRVHGVVLINPALDTRKLPNANFTHIYFNEGDLVVLLSALLPFNSWGAMGRVGYRGDITTGVLNIDCAHPPYDLPPLDGHSVIFESPNICPWGRYIADQVHAEVCNGEKCNG